MLESAKIYDSDNNYHKYTPFFSNIPPLPIKFFHRPTIAADTDMQRTDALPDNVRWSGASVYNLNQPYGLTIMRIVYSAGAASGAAASAAGAAASSV